MNIIREIQKFLFPKTFKCIYRKDVLEYALKHHTYNSIPHNGLCISIYEALSHYGVDIPNLPIRFIIPLFNKTRASKFNCDNSKNSTMVYWWPKGEWNTGRLDFLKWLIEQYKDDKTNLREL